MILDITGRRYELIFKDDCIQFCEITLIDDKDNPGHKKEKRSKPEYYTSLSSVYSRILLLSLSKKNNRIKDFEDMLRVIHDTNEEFRKLMKL